MNAETETNVIADPKPQGEGIRLQFDVRKLTGADIDFLRRLAIRLKATSPAYSTWLIHKLVDVLLPTFPRLTEEHGLVMPVEPELREPCLLTFDASTWSNQELGDALRASLAAFGAAIAGNMPTVAAFLNCAATAVSEWSRGRLIGLPTPRNETPDSESQL